MSAKIEYCSEFRVGEGGILVCRTGQNIGLYTVTKQIGHGGFGRVVQATKEKTGDIVAIKLMNGDSYTRKVAVVEIEALKNIAKKDPENVSLCIKMLDYAINEKYSYIVFPLLGQSVSDFIMENSEQPFPMDQVRHISHQLCHAVSFLHRNGMTHTDLKAENIMFVDSRYVTTYDKTSDSNIRRIIKTDIRIIDFGCLTMDKDVHKPIVSTRNYRAPEVILRLGWSQPCDIWSMGCTLIDLYTGNLLFCADGDRHHLAMMERILGPIPLKMTTSTETKYFNNGMVDWSWKGYEESEAMCTRLNGFKLRNFKDDEVLFDLIKKMLEYEPEKRIRVSDALAHPFFDKVIKTDRELTCDDKKIGIKHMTEEFDRLNLSG